MKKSDNKTAIAERPSPPRAASHGNGLATAGAAPAEVSSADLNAILASLQTMRDGDFSVRLPGSWTGVAGKLADTFNEIVTANQQMANELNRVGQAVGKEGRTRERIRFHQSKGGARWKCPSTPS
jgi:hypothetical protein